MIRILRSSTFAIIAIYSKHSSRRLVTSFDRRVRKLLGNTANTTDNDVFEASGRFRSAKVDVDRKTPLFITPPLGVYVKISPLHACILPCGYLGTTCKNQRNVRLDASKCGRYLAERLFYKPHFLTNSTETPGKDHGSCAASVENCDSTG